MDLQIVEIDVRNLFQTHAKLDQWIIWVDSVVTKSIDQMVKQLKRSMPKKLNHDGDIVEPADPQLRSSPIQGPLLQKGISSGDEKYETESCKKFILNWNLYGNLILRDFSFRSSHGLGELHLTLYIIDKQITHSLYPIRLVAYDQTIFRRIHVLRG